MSQEIDYYAMAAEAIYDGLTTLEDASVDLGVPLDLEELASSVAALRKYKPVALAGWAKQVSSLLPSEAPDMDQ